MQCRREIHQHRREICSISEKCVASDEKSSSVGDLSFSSTVMDTPVSECEVREVLSVQMGKPRRHLHILKDSTSPHPQIPGPPLLKPPVPSFFRAA